ncbi:MAG: SPOR domain-containing protein [Burkholderiales bacterium]|nr:SPOR domain-containing protein [Burkholderiales bacterium]
MAFFKFRKGGDEHPAPAPAPESVEALRKRARHRLIGAAILVLIGVVGFPLLFDNQPRPIAVDIPIEIPDKAKVKPLNATAQPPAPVAQGAVTTTPASAAVAAPVAKTESKPEPKPEAKPEPKAEAKAAPKPEPKAEAKTEVKPAPAPAVKPAEKPAETAKAPASTARFIVQVGAFAEVLKAREARQKLEKAGLKTYTQVVQTPDGKRIRVRVGPYESKAEVDKVADKIKKLDLPAAILEL